MTKKLKVFVALLFVVTSSVLLVQSFRGSSRPEFKDRSTPGLARAIEAAEGAPAGQPAETGAEKAEALKSILGEDDGMACAIFFAADLSGNLETCG
ncbi:MAG: hypothetical protein HY650_15900 [Acidobacteria bacterium]|nr:hypothetical protein [Acidobacteriota bacterium]